MRITVSDIVNRDNIIGHMILNSASAGSKEFGDSFVTEGNQRYGEIKMTVNGFDIDISVFANHLQSSLDELIEREAEKLLTDKCEQMKTVVYDLAEKMSQMAEDAIRGTYDKRDNV